MNKWEEIAKNRAEIRDDDNDDFNFLLGRFDPYLFGFILLVLSLSIAAILAVASGK